MPEFIKKIFEQLNLKPTSVNELIKAAKASGHELSPYAAKCYLYQKNYAPTSKEGK